MARKIPGWLLGCGIGCALIAVLGVVLGTMGALFVRDMFKGFSNAVDSREALEAKYGPPEEFTPPPDGAVPPDRMEAFLAVRDATQPSREAVMALFSALPMSAREAEEMDRKPFFEKMRAVWSIARPAMNLGKEFGAFFESRNKALMDNGMGTGEYTYIYALAYYSLLGHSPTDGPEEEGFHLESSDDAHGPRPGGRDGQRLLTRVHGNIVSMMRHQLGSLPAPGAGGPADAWRQTLESEIAALEADPGRVPWRDGLPDAIAASIEPYRERLEATYSATMNEFELARNRRRGRWTIQAD